MRQQYDKLVDMASEELIRDDVFKDKSKALLSQIKDMEDNVTDTTNRAASWREGLHKTIDVIAHGREQAVLPPSATYYWRWVQTRHFNEGRIELRPFEWLIPIQKGLPALKAEYEMVRTPYSGSAEEKAATIADIKTKWLAMYPTGGTSFTLVYSHYTKS